MATAPITETAASEATLTAPTGGLSLRKNFSWTFVGNVVYAACQWGILVVLAKLGTPEMVGQFALGLAVTAPVMMFSMLQLRGVQATDARREYQFGDYLALRLITTALALTVIAGIVAVSGYKRETALVILIVGAMKGVDALSDVYYGLWQQHERMDGIAQALMLNGVVSTAVLVAIMVATGNIVLATLGTATGSLGALAFTLFRNRRLALAAGPAARPHFQTLLLWRLTQLALPLGVVALLWSLNVNIPRYFIQSYLDESHLGIFAAIGYVMIAGTTIITALGQSTSARMAIYYAKGQHEQFRRILIQLVSVAAGISALGVIGSILWGRIILTLLYSPEYGKFRVLFTLMMVSAGLKYVGSFLDYGLIAVRKFKTQSIISAVVTGVTALISWLSIARFGLSGAAWAMIGGTLIQVVLAVVIIQRATSVIGCERRPENPA